MDITLRPASAEDLPAMGVLGAVLVRTHHEFDPERFFRATPRIEEGYATFLAGQLGDPDAIVLVAERDGRPIGYGYASVEGTDYMSLRGPAGVLHDLVVDPVHRGNGAGSLLLGRILQELRDRGVRQVVLSTATRNEAGRRLFERAGFRPTMVEMTVELKDGGP